MAQRPQWINEFDESYAMPPEIQELITEKLAEDVSWHNDVCPSVGVFQWNGEDLLRLFFEHPDPARREVPGHGRFGLSWWDGEGRFINSMETDDVHEVVRLYREKRAALRGPLIEYPDAPAP